MTLFAVLSFSIKDSIAFNLRLNFSFSESADINPILHKIAHFNRVNKENKKRDKSQKQDLSRCVDNSIEISNISITPVEFLEVNKSIQLII